MQTEAVLLQQPVGRGRMCIQLVRLLCTLKFTTRRPCVIATRALNVHKNNNLPACRRGRVHTRMLRQMSDSPADENCISSECTASGRVYTTVLLLLSLLYRSLDRTFLYYKVVLCSGPGRRSVLVLWFRRSGERWRIPLSRRSSETASFIWPV